MGTVRQFSLDTFYRLSGGRGPTEEYCRIMKVTGFSWSLPQTIYGHVIDTKTGQTFEASGEAWGDRYLVFAHQVEGALTLEEVQEIVHSMHERLNVFFGAHLPNIPTRYVLKDSL